MEGLASLPAACMRSGRIRVFKERWRTERMYEDINGELGFDSVIVRECRSHIPTRRRQARAGVMRPSFRDLIA
jgi:hypothetical protein